LVFLMMIRSGWLRAAHRLRKRGESALVTLGSPHERDRRQGRHGASDGVSFDNCWSAFFWDSRVAFWGCLLSLVGVRLFDAAVAGSGKPY
jgi:hypothetical protein